MLQDLANYDGSVALKQVRTESDGDTKKGCQKPALQQKIMLLIVVNGW